MEFMKKQSVGFYLGILTVIISAIAAGLYMGNCNTSYFKSLGVNSTVTLCLVAGLICEAVFICGNEIKGDLMVLDLFAVASAVFLAVGTVTFVSTRVNGLAAIMTFNNNASTMADFKNTIVAFAFCAAAILLSIVTSFFKVVNEA